jgi:flagellar motor component MotA
MDPNVQVAIVSVFSTIIVTIGVIATAVINNRKERVKAASAGVEAGLDEKDVLERMLSLIAENERKEKTIRELRKKVQILTLSLTNDDLRAQLREENSHL